MSVLDSNFDAAIVQFIIISGMIILFFVYGDVVDASEYTTGYLL